MEFLKPPVNFVNYDRKWRIAIYVPLTLEYVYYSLYMNHNPNTHFNSRVMKHDAVHSLLIEQLYVGYDIKPGVQDACTLAYYILSSPKLSR